MGRAGFEPATLGLKVPPARLRQIALRGKCLQRAHYQLCAELRQSPPSGDKLVRAPYAHLSPPVVTAHRSGPGRPALQEASSDLCLRRAAHELASLGERWRILAPHTDLTPRSYPGGLPAQERLSSLLDISWTFRCPACQRASPDGPRPASQAAEVTCHGNAHADLSRPDLASGFEVIMAEARARPSEADPPRRSAGAPRPARFGECSGGSAGPPRSCRGRPRGRRWVDDQPMSVHGLLVTRLRSRQL
jgi:hypothetical protein